MKRSTLAMVEPIARVERQQLQFGPVRQVRRLVDQEASLAHSRFYGHADERSIGMAAHKANGVVAAEVLCKRAAAADDESRPLIRTRRKKRIRLQQARMR